MRDYTQSSDGQHTLQQGHTTFGELPPQSDQKSSSAVSEHISAGTVPVIRLFSSPISSVIMRRKESKKLLLARKMIGVLKHELTQ